MKRFLSDADIPTIVQSFTAIGWNKPTSLFERYYKEQESQVRFTWVAFHNTLFAGYITLAWQSQYPLFATENIPEIMDLNVLPVYRKLGIGSALLDAAEACAFARYNTVGIGVGLYDGYGSAQRLYIKRGYIPDGKGVTYNGNPIEWNKPYPIDDLLILWLTKNNR